ncbi:MAG: hypothetical protein AB7G13_29740 [Lautropia sp.]
MAKQFSYRGYSVRIQVLRLGTRYQPRFAIDDGDWQPAVQQDGLEWAVEAADANARAQVDALLDPPPTAARAARSWPRLSLARLLSRGSAQQATGSN